MALFSKKPKETPKEVEAPPRRPDMRLRASGKTTDARISHVLIAPWFSEKALIGTEKGIYVFSVPESATKIEIADAIEKMYKVRPRKIALVHLPGKKKMMRGRRGYGMRVRRHKAYVYLKKGETITFT